MISYRSALVICLLAAHYEYVSLLKAVRAFHPGLTVSFARTSSSTALGITSEEILARARKAAGVPKEEPEQLYVFDDDLLDDMQSALLKLERRVQEGPGSLSVLDVEELDGEMKRIIAEMHRNPDKRLPRPNTNDSAESTPFTESQRAPLNSPAHVMEPLLSSTPLQTSSLEKPVRQSPATTNDISDDEGPAYDGSGGMGQARGTVNTYSIEGMDEMSSEEYRKALDQAISDRQKKRRESGVVGNASSWNYLNSLGGTSKYSTGALKREDLG